MTREITKYRCCSHGRRTGAKTTRRGRGLYPCYEAPLTHGKRSWCSRGTSGCRQRWIRCGNAKRRNMALFFCLWLRMKLTIAIEGACCYYSYVVLHRILFIVGEPVAWKRGYSWHEPFFVVFFLRYMRCCWRESAAWRMRGIMLVRSFVRSFELFAFVKDVKPNEFCRMKENWHILRYNLGGTGTWMRSTYIMFYVCWTVRYGCATVDNACVLTILLDIHYAAIQPLGRCYWPARSSLCGSYTLMHEKYVLLLYYSCPCSTVEVLSQFSFCSLVLGVLFFFVLSYSRFVGDCFFCYTLL